MTLKMKRSSGMASNLPEPVHQQLNMYAIAAVAVAVSFLALTSPSEAKIVYTPTKVVIKGNYNYNLDLNHDGITDFVIAATPFYTHYCQQGPGASDLLAVGPVQYVQGNGEVATAPYAEALDSGVEIGPNQSFDYYYATMASVAKGWIFDFRRNGCFDHHEILGDWVNVSDRYIGLAFLINGQTHYGWARFSVQVGYVYVNATLTGYAYETSTGESIKAGQTKEAADDSTNENFDPDASLTNPIPDTSRPASLGTLALGARGIPLWRRKEPEWSSIGVPAVKN